MEDEKKDPTFGDYAAELWKVVKDALWWALLLFP